MAGRNYNKISEIRPVTRLQTIRSMRNCRKRTHSEIINRSELLKELSGSVHLRRSARIQFKQDLKEATRTAYIKRMSMRRSLLELNGGISSKQSVRSQCFMTDAIPRFSKIMIRKNLVKHIGKVIDCQSKRRKLARGQSSHPNEKNLLPDNYNTSKLINRDRTKERKMAEKCDTNDMPLSERNPIEDECKINRLPLEILNYIFKYLSPHDRKKVRLVCKLWYDNCNENEKIVIKTISFKGNITDYRKCLEKCQFKNLNIVFEGALGDHLPVSSWRKLGNRIQSLEFYDGQLGNKTMKNIILYCNNLRHLYLRVSSHKSQEAAFDSLETLEKFVYDMVVRKELRTLEIYVNDENVSFDIDVWRRFLEAIYRIFPNVTRFGFGRFHYASDGSVKYMCKFSREMYTLNDTKELPFLHTNLALSIFCCNDWVKSLDALSGLRMRTFSLQFCKKMYTPLDDYHIQNFFQNQTKLKSVRVEFSSWIGTVMLRNVLYGIVDNCIELSELVYISPHHKHYLTPSEITLLLTKMSKVKSLSIGGFSVDNSPLSWICPPSFKLFNIRTLELSNMDEKICILFIRHYTWLQHLTIKKLISDAVLQNIFQYSTELKSLNIQLHSSCTNFGLAGVQGDHEDGTAQTGYSIKRLEKLEQLTIKIGVANLDDSIFSEFSFPKLWYFNCSKESMLSKSIIDMTKKMPCLREIQFSCDDMTLKKLREFCKFSKNLYHLHTNIDMFGDKLESLFTVCPSLRFISNIHSTKVYSYSPYTKKIRKNSW